LGRGLLATREIHGEGAVVISRTKLEGTGADKPGPGGVTHVAEEEARVKRYTFIIVPEGTGRLQRFAASERDLRRFIGIAAAAALTLLLVVAHYLTLCNHMAEFRGVRAEAERVHQEAERVRQEAQSRADERQRMADELAQAQEFERRVRVIANLPKAGSENTTEEPASPHVGRAAKRARHPTPSIETPTAAAPMEVPTAEATETPAAAPMEPPAAAPDGEGETDQE
jgi:hypothetical protein